MALQQRWFILVRLILTWSKKYFPPINRSIKNFYFVNQRYGQNLDYFFQFTSSNHTKCFFCEQWYLTCVILQKVTPGIVDAIAKGKRTHYTEMNTRITALIRFFCAPPIDKLMKYIRY